MNCHTYHTRPVARLFNLANLANLAESFFPELRTESSDTPAATAPSPRSWTPAVDVTETATNYVITADVAEVKAEEVNVTVHEGVLTVKGERKLEANPQLPETDTKGKVLIHHLKEIHYGAFQRNFSLPKDADADAVEAAYKNGFLTVTIAKKADRQAKAITVKAA